MKFEDQIDSYERGFEPPDDPAPEPDSQACDHCSECQTDENAQLNRLVEETITHSAILLALPLPADHYSVSKMNPLKKPATSGFLTSAGRYVDRHEAMRIALAAGQVQAGETFQPKTLFSEDVPAPEPENKVAALQVRIEELEGRFRLPENEGRLMQENSRLQSEVEHLKSQAGPDSCADLVLRNQRLQSELDAAKERISNMLSGSEMITETLGKDAALIRDLTLERDAAIRQRDQLIEALTELCDVYSVEWRSGDAYQIAAWTKAAELLASEELSKHWRADVRDEICAECGRAEVWHEPQCTDGATCDSEHHPFVSVKARIEELERALDKSLAGQNMQQHQENRLKAGRDAAIRQRDELAAALQEIVGAEDNRALVHARNKLLASIEGEKR